MKKIYVNTVFSATMSGYEDEYAAFLRNTGEITRDQEKDLLSGVEVVVEKTSPGGLHAKTTYKLVHEGNVE